MAKLADNGEWAVQHHNVTRNVTRKNLRVTSRVNMGRVQIDRLRSKRARPQIGIEEMEDELA